VAFFNVAERNGRRGAIAAGSVIIEEGEIVASSRVS
jgi:hypothetical protein